MNIESSPDLEIFTDLSDLSREICEAKLARAQRLEQRKNMDKNRPSRRDPYLARQEELAMDVAHDIASALDNVAEA